MSIDSTAEVISLVIAAVAGGGFFQAVKQVTLTKDFLSSDAKRARRLRTRADSLSDVTSVARFWEGEFRSAEKRNKELEVEIERLRKLLKRQRPSSSD